MAYTKEEQERFVELRAKGFSFEKIAAETKISKPTLIKWAGELHKEIATAEYVDLQALLEQHRLNRRAKVEETALQLEKVIKAIEGKDLSGESLKDLLCMKRDLEESLTRRAREVTAYTGFMEGKNPLKWFDDGTEKILKID